MNKPATHLVLTGLLVMLLLAGCAASAPQIAYYSLYAPGQPAFPAQGADLQAMVVSVGPVTTPDILKQTQIATGGADGRYRLAEYHRWSGELDRDFARAVAEQLSGRLGTERVAVFPWDQQLKPACRVLLDVLGMGGETGKEATLAVRWSLVDPGGTVPLLVRRSDLHEVPAAAGYPAWVAAQQRNIAKLGEEIAGEVRLFVKP